MIRTFCILCAAFILVGCQKDETIAGQTTPDTVWTLVELNGSATQAEFTIQFDKDGKTFGQADCNRYTTTQTAPLPWISFGPIAGTKALCPNADEETAFLNALGQVETVEVAGDTMLMSGSEAELVFKSGD